VSANAALRDNGDCYQAAAQRVLFPWEHSTPDGAVLVHGRPTLTVPPYDVYGHAWIELPNGCVWECSNGNDIVAPRSAYYRAGQIDPTIECYRYDAKLARRWVLWSGHWGPWEGVEGSGPVAGHGDGPRPPSGAQTHWDEPQL
jgi:hypothetical protein